MWSARMLEENMDWVSETQSRRVEMRMKVELRGLG